MWISLLIKYRSERPNPGVSAILWNNPGDFFTAGKQPCG
jgi:hypothetical protein